MSWNIVPECISTAFLCIIWVYSRKGSLVPSVKNRLFQSSLLITFCAMTSNILSTLLIASLSPATLFLTWVVTLVYFVTTPLMGLVYFFYTVANIYDDPKTQRRCFIATGIPGAVYLLLALITPFTKSLFDITLEGGYVQGPLVASTYLIFYLYCIGCVFMVAVQGKRIDPSIRAILFSFPAIAGLVIIIQLLQPSIMLSGSAATAAILIIYLYLQNKQISIDYLTHLPNRHQFLKMLELYLRKEQRFSIVVLSLREFKSINDTHGQQSGDNLLAAVSSYLSKELGLREGEIYRYSGDEFALLLRNGDEPRVKRLVEQVLARMMQAWEVSDCTCLLSAAIGIVNYPKTAMELSGLTNGLEHAVAHAKAIATEGYHVCYCTPELLTATKRRHIIAEELEMNLQTDGFAIYYQPIYSVESGRFVRAEALLRMPTTRLEQVFPDEFIPVAEESGMIIDITYLVLDKVCRFIRRIEGMGISLESINVNFSALQFSQKDLFERIVEIMERNGVPFAQIKTELTETALAENADTITACLYRMNAMGIQVALDDFGTGYSNLISVLDLPLETVKLDRNLVWSAMKNKRCSIAVKNFCRAFRELGMTVLAEGVETEEQRQFVVEAGCTLIQGFLYARPMPEDAFIAFLQAHSTTEV